MPTPPHPLRQIRTSTPYNTRAAFAGFLGVPAAVIQAVESGRALPSPRLAARIMERTGADEVELLRASGGGARTLSGRPYTPSAFALWDGSPAQAAVRARQAAQQQSHRERWTAILCGASPGADPAAPSPEARRAAGDALAPWQSCEFSSAAARDWKRLPPAVKRLTGWTPGLPVPPALRLSLAIQSLPSWNPADTPPGTAADNAELFPPCYFTVAAGSAGCRAAAAFWTELCHEHGIDPGTGRALREFPTGSWRGFFRQTGDRFEPHAVLAGLDPEETGKLPRHLFARGSMLHGAPGSSLAGQTMAFMEGHSADAGSPAGILLFASLEGSTASALSSLLLERLRRRFPAVPVLVAGVLPLAGVSQVLTAPWHTALAMQAVRRHASAALLFSNDQLLQLAAKVWHLPSPGYAEANQLIARCLCALTAPLRFGGTDAPPVDLATLLEAFPPAPGKTFPVFTAQCRPLDTITDRRLKSLPLPRLVSAAVRLAAAAGFLGPRAGALALFPRVRFLPGPEWLITGDPPEINPSGASGTGGRESITLAGHSPAIRRTLQSLARQAREAWSAETAARAAAELGVSESSLRSAIEALAETA